MHVVGGPPPSLRSTAGGGRRRDETAARRSTLRSTTAGRYGGHVLPRFHPRSAPRAPRLRVRPLFAQAPNVLSTDVGNAKSIPRRPDLRRGRQPSQTRLAYCDQPYAWANPRVATSESVRLPRLPLTLRHHGTIRVAPSSTACRA